MANYVVVSAAKYPELKDQVEALIEAGFIPAGGLLINDDLLHQAMVRGSVIQNWVGRREWHGGPL